MITREDGLCYIGITKNFKKRIREHSRTKRFSIGIQHTEVLFKSLNYIECEAMEEIYIEKHDTFKNGLNMTKNGKGKNPEVRFNTLGMKFTDETRRKMSDSKKGKYTGKNNHRYGITVTEETRQRISDSNKNVRHTSKLKEEDILYITQYNGSIDSDIIVAHLKKTQIPRYLEGKLQLNEFKGKNGLPLSRERLLSIQFSKIYNVTPQCVYLVLTKKTWNNPDVKNKHK